MLYFELIWTWVRKKERKLARSNCCLCSPPIEIQTAPVCLTGREDGTAVTSMCSRPVSHCLCDGVRTWQAYELAGKIQWEPAAEPEAEGSFPVCLLVHSACASLSRGFSPLGDQSLLQGLFKHPVLGPSPETLTRQAGVHFCQVPRWRWCCSRGRVWTALLYGTSLEPELPRCSL